MTQATDTDIRELRDLILGLDKKIDGLEPILDKKIDGLDKKLDVYIARSTEQIKALDTQLSDFKKSTDTQLSDIRTQLRSQDTRLWGFISALAVAVVGLLAKLLFFPQA